jgi:hypothetical protein
MSDEDFDYKIPITEEKLRASLQADFLSPPFELLSSLQAEVQVRGMKGMPEYGQDPNAMNMYSMCGYDAGTPSTAAGTPPSATDSDELNDSSTPGDDNMPSPVPSGSRRKMMNGSNGHSPQNNFNGQMPGFFPIANGSMGNGAMMVPFPGSPVGGAHGMMPMTQQVVVYCVPVEQVPWVQASMNGGSPTNCVDSNNEVQCTPCDANGSPIAMGQPMALPGNAFMIPASPNGAMTGAMNGMLEVSSPMAHQNGYNSNSPNDKGMKPSLALQDVNKEEY